MPLHIAALAATMLSLACNSEDTNSNTNSSSGGTSNLGGNGGTDTTAPNSGGGTSSGTGQAGATKSYGGTAAGGGATATKPAPVGIFSVVLTPANPDTGTDAYAALKGIVRSAALPDPKSWSVSAEQSGCQLVIPTAPLCDPKCVAGQTCVAGGTCVAAPTAKSVGTVTVKGVKTAAGATEFAMDPSSTNSYSPDPDLAYPPFDEGATVTVAAAGGDYSAFTISTKGIKPLAEVPTSVAIDTNKPAALKWSAAGVGAGSSIEISLDISQHGGTKGVINCIVADNGSFEVPGPLITQLIKLGVAGFPMISIARKSVGSTDLGHGRVDLLLTSALEVPVEIPGLSSCNTEIPCPSGKICQSDYTCK